LVMVPPGRIELPLPYENWILNPRGVQLNSFVLSSGKPRVLGYFN
jgi:hypothetical protein